MRWLQSLPMESEVLGLAVAIKHQELPEDIYSAFFK
jgi:hypothetical protein